jgi:hypothetical protein
VIDVTMITIWGVVGKGPNPAALRAAGGSLMAMISARAAGVLGVMVA